ncbi:MAG: HEAT repeat domain-containing protein [Deltaproteobacteria bacterium]|nr:HEAT repeat domain-containing protein [Deltaproteobacteria bacterium]MBW2210063.1 HEAT repeat domain-containing protein [Deltaproteobacteria bacterium]MBW2213438.1 HEAT repeat domain-containing protein [Deltaproteobacteria bacterium]MBW2379227.1 HEAT repeat domain-containing protein [Deltaproteobacteria bacterium]MBW2551436.1 HEAT repeat domain-containing protein [Deltaproteobacteria bacterium]
MRFSIRREDRRNLAVGFVGLLAIMTAHSVMETARDTLFLTSLPATHLPRAYLAIALLAILELEVHERVLRQIRDRRTLLAASLLFGSLVTLGFWALLDDLGAWAPFGFYVWTGLLITVVLIEFWLLLDDAVTVTQAKRIFPAIAAGGVIGAMLGSLLAEGLLRVASPIELVFAAAIILTLTSATPFLWKMPRDASADHPVSEPGRSLGWLLRDSYLSRVLTLVLMGTIALTIVDFVFKSTVADHIPVEGLGAFFARFYLGLNSVALLVQIVGAGWLLRAFGAHRSSALLPVLIFGGAMGLALGPILPFAVALKAVDGSLRHTLYRSSVEVLYLPLDSRRRERAKGIIEVFGHRVGQAVASLLIIVAVGVGLTTQHLGVILLFLVAAWVMAIMSTRHQYVDEFRARLRQGVIDTQLELEQLDRHSLDVLLNALNSDQDPEVLAAIDIFDRHGRADMIPVLVLYHPSTEVRSRALEAFAEASDRRFVPVARRMLSDDDPDVRAAALRALTAVVPSRKLLEEKLDLEASIVRATALVGLLSLNHETGNGGGVSASKLDEWTGSASARTQSSLARAIRHEGGPVFHETLIKLIETADDSVRLETLRAMEASPDARYLPRLLPLLASSDLRAAARKAVVAIGSEALLALDDALADPSTPRKVRRRIPHTIILFESQEAADILLQHLEREREGGVRLKISRALGRLQATQPSLVLDDTLLQEQLRSSLLRVVQLLQWRAAIESNGTPETTDAELLRVALQDKERAALERAFGLMGLRHPEENFTLVWRGVTSDNPRMQAAGHEVLEAALPGSFREAVLAIIDDGEPPARRARVAAASLGATVRQMSHEEAVTEMMQDRSEVVREIAAHHTRELDQTAAQDAAQEVPRLV